MPKALDCMSVEEIRTNLHHPHSRFPPIRPCNTPDASNSKRAFTPEEFHCLTGCCCFWNYQHIISTSNSGILTNTGEFPLSLGTYTTIPKAPRGKPIDRIPSKCLDIVHIDIAFGDCISISSYKFALVIVNRATRYNWTFGLNPSSTAISSLPFLHFAPKLDLSPINFDATATKNYLVVPYNPFSTPITPPSRRVQRDINLPMAWWNHTGKLWSTCPGLILLKNKCFKCSGITPSSMRLA